MTKFIQIHCLTPYSAANLNRDDTGAPKTVVCGGATRLRISSQSQKRAWRTSELFADNLGRFIGKRTCRIGREAAAVMIEAGVKENDAVKWGEMIANACGKAKKGEKGKDPLIKTETEQLVHISPEEMAKVEELAVRLASENREPKKEELAFFSQNNRAVDIALFGRMLASSPKYNVEAACQVAHAIGVTASIIEDDFFTAVDDLRQEAADEAGAGHLGETAFGSTVFYSYICIDYDLLVKNLGGDEELAKLAVRTLAEAAMTTPPTGHQNSFASRAYAAWAMAEVGESQPRSLAAAFFRPVYGTNVLEDSICRIEELRNNMNSVYGDTTESYSFDVFHKSGTMKELLNFITQ